MKLKSLLFIQSIVIVILIILIFKGWEPGDKDCSGNGLSDDQIIAAIETSKHTLEERQVRELYNNYKRRFIPEIKRIQSDILNPDGTVLTRTDYLPTEYSLVPLEKLKRYISFLDVLQKKNRNQKISGIAISFGAYSIDKQVKEDRSEGSKIIDPLRKGDYRGRLTTYFTPTYYDENIDSQYDAARHVPFYVNYENDADKFTGTYKPLFCYLDPDNCPDSNQIKLQKASFADIMSFDNAQNTTGNVGIVSFNEFTDMPPKKSGTN